MIYDNISFIFYLGFFPSAVFLILASYAACDQIALSVTYMVLATASLSFNAGGFSVNHLDIGPRFSGILMGITNTAGTIAGCITPSVTGYFTNNHVRIYRFFVFSAIIIS